MRRIVLWQRRASKRGEAAAKGESNHLREHIEEVIFVEVKSGSARLTHNERSLKEAIENMRVRWHTSTASPPRHPLVTSRTRTHDLTYGKSPQRRPATCLKLDQARICPQQYIFNELVRSSIMRGSGILLIVVAFVLGAVGFWFWEQLAPLASYSSGYSQRYNAGYANGYSSQYYPGYDNGYGRGMPDSRWGPAGYGVSAPYPPRPRRRVLPPPCYMPCDDY